jgi:cellulose biosynthesis protein BcsQ
VWLLLINPLTTTYLRMRYVVIIPVAVEKLAFEKSAKIRTRQEALQTISTGRLDIFYHSISGYFREKGVFQQPQGIITSNLKVR